MSPKTALCDFAMRYKPRTSERIAGSKSTGRENNPTKTVEYQEIKKLEESIAHTTKNKIIIMSCILSQRGCSDPKPALFSEILTTTIACVYLSNGPLIGCLNLSQLGFVVYFILLDIRILL